MDDLFSTSTTHLYTVHSRYDCDGQTVQVWVVKLPAEFYELRVKAGTNSVGDVKPGYRVGFGSGMGSVAVAMAKQISEGMIEFEPEQEN